MPQRKESQAEKWQKGQRWKERRQKTNKKWLASDPLCPPSPGFILAAGAEFKLCSP